MGLFGGDSVTNFVRELLVCRVETDPDALRSGFGRRDVSKLQSAQVMSLPEMTIAKIMEAIYANLANPNILDQIEMHRSKIGALPKPITDSVEEYILQRVALEHPRSITEAHVKLCISACHNFFGADSLIGNALLSVERARRNQLEEDLYFTWFAIDDRFVQGSLTEDQFIERIDVLYERLAPLIERRKQKEVNLRFQRGIFNLED